MTETGWMQASMKERSNYAELGAILGVLTEVKHLVDFVRCSAVCKSWQAACQRVHPTSIYVVPDRKGFVFNPEGLDKVLKWLQLKNRAGCLHSLQKICVAVDGDYDCTPDCRNEQRLQFFTQSIVALAGSWHLLSCTLLLHSPIDMAVPMLPPSLRELVLEVRTGTLPECVSLWMFEGLRELQKLELLLSSEEEPSVVAQRQRTAEFRVDAHLSALTSLQLSPWVISMPADQTLSDYMPSLQKLNVYVIPAQAQSLLDLASLHTLTLTIASILHELESHKLEVRASSHLRFLNVFCSLSNNLILHVSNASVRHYTRGVHAVRTPMVTCEDDDYILRDLSD